MPILFGGKEASDDKTRIKDIFQNSNYYSFHNWPMCFCVAVFSFTYSEG